MTIRRITRQLKERNFGVYDLEWNPDTMQPRLYGFYDGSHYRAFKSVNAFMEAILRPAIILAGGYIEERRAGTVDGVGRGSRIARSIFEPGSVNVIRSTHFHRVDLLEEDSWSLFIAGPRVQSWGFWDRHTGEFVPWREFISRIRGGEGWAGRDDAIRQAQKGDEPR